MFSLKPHVPLLTDRDDKNDNRVANVNLEITLKGLNFLKFIMIKEYYIAFGIQNSV